MRPQDTFERLRSGLRFLVERTLPPSHEASAGRVIARAEAVSVRVPAEPRAQTKFRGRVLTPDEEVVGSSG